VGGSLGVTALPSKRSDVLGRWSLRLAFLSSLIVEVHTIQREINLGTKQRFTWECVHLYSANVGGPHDACPTLFVCVFLPKTTSFA